MVVSCIVSFFQFTLLFLSFSFNYFTIQYEINKSNQIYFKPEFVHTFVDLDELFVNIYSLLGFDQTCSTFENSGIVGY